MKTKLIRSLHNITPAEQGAVVTIGNFDGVHKGHQQLITEVIHHAHKLNAPSLIITFEPHPFEFFAREQLAIARITRLREKFSLLAAFGIDNVLILPFNQLLAKITASDFIDTILSATLRIRHIFIGDDFRFGHKRQGDIRLLQARGQERGFAVTATPTVTVNAERVSSTRVRKALVAGDHGMVKHLLGRSYSMLGRIHCGKQLGRQLGFPTANIYLHRDIIPVRGVYTVFMHGVADYPWPGVANIGTRPTVDGSRSLLEVHLLDFNQNIYGRYVQVEFCEKLRDEVRYPNVDLLKAQIAKDVKMARMYFNQLEIRSAGF